MATSQSDSDAEERTDDEMATCSVCNVNFIDDDDNIQMCERCLEWFCVGRHTHWFCDGCYNNALAAVRIDRTLERE